MRISELAIVGQQSTAKLPTCVKRIEHSGRFMLVGHVPAECVDPDAPYRSRIWNTEQDALDAALATDTLRIQRVDNSFARGQ